MIERDGKLCMWVIYERFSDYPDEFVARLFKLDEPQPDLLRCPSLEHLRDLLMEDHDLICMTRGPQDEPHIVEIWF